MAKRISERYKLVAETENQGGEQTEVLDPRWIVLRPSRLALAMLAAGVLPAALAIVWANPLPNLSPVWKAVAAVLTLAALVWETRKLRHNGSSAVHGLYLVDLEPLGQDRVDAPRTGIRLQVGHAKVVQEGLVLNGAFVTPFFTAIPYRLEGDPAWRPARILPLWPDSLGREAFRALRVRLKWK